MERSKKSNDCMLEGIRKKAEMVSAHLAAAKKPLQDSNMFPILKK